jgi:teichoic acid transport system ATP-binding protein
VTDGRISALLELGAGFNYEYSGIENIYLNGTMMGFSDQEIEERMDDILSFADIGDFVYQPVKTYSSGMFVRLAFAVAINIDPEILIVDEALSVGDVFFQAKCYRKFEDFKKEGKTILFVSHDLGSISRYCDRVILLDHGTKLDEGTPKEMVDLYKRVIVHQGPDNQKKAGKPIQARGANGETSGTRTTEPESGQKVARIRPAQPGLGQIATESGSAEPGAGQKAAETGSAEPGAADQTVAGTTGDKSGDQTGTSRWITPLEMNPGTLEYGDKRAEMLGFRLTDENGVMTNAIEKGTRLTMQVRVRYNEDLEDPIFAYTIKDKRGTEITGTNTMFEQIAIPPKKAGETDIVTYVQNVDLQGGEYLISFGLTGYRGGEFVVYHRLYDACNLTVVSKKNTVGFYDMNSVITVEPEI